MKLILVGVNSKFIHSNLAVRYLKSYTDELDYNCKIREFSINDRVERIVEELINEKPNVIGFSCYIWNIEYVIKISTLIKLIDSSIEIFYGGPEVSYDSESYLNSPCDFIIEGEGEETYKDFVKVKIKNDKFNTNKDYEKIKGLYYKKNGQFIYGGKRELMNMNNLVFPYKIDDNLDNKIVYYEASRGCPFNCKYCLSSTLHGVRFLDIERVKKELKFFIDKKVRLVKFVDRTFNCNPKFAMDIWKFLIEQSTEATFHFEISADILNNDEIKLLSKAPKGRFQFEVGVQTTNDIVLKNINRTANFKDIEEKVIELEKIKNIKQHLDLIAGLPDEDFSSFKKSFNDLYKIKPEEIQLGFLKLLKGSLMREEVDKWGMVYSPYPPYEIIKTKDISYKELNILKKVEELVDKYYNSGKFINILNYFIKKFNSPFEFYYDLAMFCEDKGIFSRNISSPDYYKVFLEFNKEILKEDDNVLKEIIKYDYLIFNKKKWIPDFLDRNMNKKIERDLKEKIISNKLTDDENISLSNFSKEYHIEKFGINIVKLIEKDIIENKTSYILFKEKDNKFIKDISFL